jgi:hypothetical protein
LFPFDVIILNDKSVAGGAAGAATIEILVTLFSLIPLALWTI